MSCQHLFGSGGGGCSPPVSAPGGNIAKVDSLRSYMPGKKVFLTSTRRVTSPPRLNSAFLSGCPHLGNSLIPRFSTFLETNSVLERRCACPQRGLYGCHLWPIVFPSNTKYRGHTIIKPCVQWRNWRGQGGEQPPPRQVKCKNWAPFSWHFDI